MKTLLLRGLYHYRKTDKYLLIHHPEIWETKIHLAVVFSVLLSCVSLLIATISPEPIIVANYVSLTFQSFMIGFPIFISVVAYIYWLTRHISYQGDSANVHLSKSTYRKQFLCYLSSSLLFTLPVVTVLMMGFIQLDGLFEVSERDPYFMERQFESFSKLILFVAGGLILLSVLVQAFKSIGWLQFTKGLILQILTTTFVIFLWDINRLLGMSISLLLFIGVVILIFDPQKLVRSFNSIPKYQFYLIFSIQLLSPIICWFIAAFPLVILTIFFSIPTLLVGCITFIMGTGLYCYSYLPQHQYYYLLHKQLPK